MTSKTRIAAVGGLAAASAAMSYPLLFRRWCLTWGARPEEAARHLPGDDLLATARHRLHPGRDDRGPA